MQRINKPTVSIGMPVFNGERYIRGALDSLLTQTFSDFELIISDNASTDGTKDICKEYSKKDSRIRYVRQVKNLGALANFQFVLDEAVGVYFMWAAYDDLRSKSFIEKLLLGFENENVVSSFPKCKQIDSEGQPVGDEIILDFIGDSSYKRIRSYWTDPRELRDIPIYGLHRANTIKRYQLKPWGSINKTNPQNCAHPVITYLLASGQYFFYKNESLFFRRIIESSSWINDVTPKTRIGNFFSYLFLIYQLHLRVICVVYLGSNSIFTTVISLPTILFSFVSDSYKHLISPIKNKYFKR